MLLDLHFMFWEEETPIPPVEREYPLGGGYVPRVGYQRVFKLQTNILTKYEEFYRFESPLWMNYETRFGVLTNIEHYYVEDYRLETSIERFYKEFFKATNPRFYNLLEIIKKLDSE